MTLHSVDGSENNSLTGNDRTLVFILGRLTVIETCLSVMALHSGAIESIKKHVLELVEAKKRSGPSSGQSELDAAVEAACTDLGRRHSLDAIFPEVPNKK